MLSTRSERTSNAWGCDPRKLDAGEPHDERPARRRQLKRQRLARPVKGVAIEAASEHDRRWFEANPDATVRHRSALPGEWPPAPAGLMVMVRVTQLMPSVRTREPITRSGACHEYSRDPTRGSNAVAVLQSQAAPDPDPVGVEAAGAREGPSGAMAHGRAERRELCAWFAKRQSLYRHPYWRAEPRCAHRLRHEKPRRRIDLITAAVMAHSRAVELARRPAPSIYPAD